MARPPRSAKLPCMSVLVAYASKRGSTTEIAETVAATLRRSGLEVTLRSVEEIDSLDDYEAAVVGSAVYAKRWRGDARHFLKRHRKALRKMPFWVFSSGPVGDPTNDNPDWMESPRFIAKLEEMGVREHVVFGGRVPAEPHGFMEKAMVDGTPDEFRDRRDWDRIRSWAEAVAADLKRVPA
jgi:menaquinone-dependent protoporphyrinogen oxidase